MMLMSSQCDWLIWTGRLHLPKSDDLDRPEEQLFDGKVQLVAQHMIQLLPDSRWIVYQGRIVFLISLVDSSCKIIAEDKRFLEFLQVNDLTASLSDCFSHLTFCENIISNA